MALSPLSLGFLFCRKDCLHKAACWLRAGPDGKHVFREHRKSQETRPPVATEGHSENQQQAGAVQTGHRSRSWCFCFTKT